MRKDVTGGYGASSSVWRSLPESEMCAVLVVVANILREPAFQVAFVNCDDVRRSRRQLPTQRSATPFRQGLSNEERRRFILRDRTAAGTSAPYFASRSKMTNLGADPNG